MGRKKEVSGSLTIDKGKYYAVINLYDETGKRKQKWICTGIIAKAKKISEDSCKSSAYREAQAFLADRLKEYGVEQHIAKKTTPTGTLFCDYLKGWIKVYKADLNTRPITAEGYESYINNHLYPYWKGKDVALEDITPKMLTEYLQVKIRKDGTKDGLSASSLQKHLAVMSLAFQQAQAENLIQHNPVRDVDAPKNTEKREFSYLHLEECRLLLKNVIEKHRDMYLPIFLAAYFGLRRSEVCGLRWSDVDMAERVIRIRHTRKKLNSTEYRETMTKTASSHRELIFGDTAYQYFDSFKAIQRGDREACKTYDNTHDYVCRNKQGKPLRLDYVSKQFPKILKENSLPHIRFHDLRASCAVQLFETGHFTPREVAEQLGHSDVRTTLGVYGRVRNESKIRVAEQRENLF